MKALSLRRPWATLILGYGKDIENRSWMTTYRGPLVIHAAQSWDPAAEAFVYSADAALHLALRGHPPISWGESVHPTGYLGVVDLLDVCTARTCQCGPWAMPGQFHWRVAHPVRFSEPIPGKGRLGFWTPPAEVLSVARAAHDGGFR